MANPDATLEQLTQTAAALGVVITPQALDQRFTEPAARCLKQVFTAAVQQVLAADPVAMMNDHMGDLGTSRHRRSQPSGPQGRTANFGTRELAHRAATFPTFVAAIAAATQGRMIPSPGGVLIRNTHRDVVGAVGVSGDSGDNDEVCALAGIEAVGLSGLPATPNG